MFAKNEQSDAGSVIGSGVVIEGEVRFSGVLRVDGAVRGKLSSSPGKGSTLIVGAGGRIDGEVAATEVVVHGTLGGVMLRCANLALASSAKVTGDLYYESIDVSSGAVVEAQLCNRSSAGEQETATLEPALVPVQPGGGG